MTLKYKTENMEIENNADEKMTVLHLYGRGLTLFFDYDELKELKTLINKVK